MSSTHLSLHFHIVFSTKDRHPWFAPSVRPRLHDFLGGIIRAEKGHPHAVGGTGDHVHVLMGLDATHSLAKVMQRLKSVSSSWIHRELQLAGFAWQEGYGGFTVSATNLRRVRNYVLNQEEHHRTKTFQQEYVQLLKRGLVTYDEKYLW
ncbi:IS200/IS605 family transposase [Roseimicrobium gellanilyticum]|nr:IS200/IS605 family transposase [Roseimicrobium gellanilyticum]